MTAACIFAGIDRIGLIRRTHRRGKCRRIETRQKLASFSAIVPLPCSEPTSCCGRRADAVAVELERQMSRDGFACPLAEVLPHRHRSSSIWPWLTRPSALRRNDSCPLKWPPARSPSRLSSAISDGRNCATPFRSLAVKDGVKSAWSRLNVTAPLIPANAPAPTAALDHRRGGARRLSRQAQQQGCNARAVGIVGGDIAIDRHRAGKTDIQTVRAPSSCRQKWRFA